MPGGMILLIEVIEGIFINVIFQALGIGLGIQILVEKLVVEQMIMLRFWKVIFVVHAGLLKYARLYRPFNGRGQSPSR
jgi:hypothetical protein